MTCFYNNILDQARSMAFKAFVAKPYILEYFLRVLPLRGQE